ncbi:MAG TPA: AAA family ATPase, partial [Acidobacteriaceae bacterium]
MLFCDLAGSTEIAAQLDPEEWRETVSSYHRAAAEAITRLGGHVAKYLGDGVMAFFGYPEAHDDDAARAARAGLAILDAMARFNEQPTHPKLSARIGIHSGAVVVGAGASKDVDVFGDAPNVAARVQAAAEPDTVLLTDATHRLVSGLFIAEDRGAHSLKGVQQPVQLYRVVQPSGVRGRLEAAAASRGLTPFVGREDELRSLMNRWERALEGEGQVALIIGEAGIGKSRLVQRFHEQIAGTPHTSVAAAAGAFFQSTPFYPVTEMLRELLAWHGDHSAAMEQLSQLEARLELAGLKPAEAIPLIAPLLNLPLPADYPPSTLSPEQQRRRLLATLVEWVVGTARAQPTVIATEDLHWADPSTLELIQLLTEQGATARLLLLYTARPEFHPQWPLRAHHTQITLNRLSTRNVRSMVEEVAARKAMSDETIATVVERTGGVPLFVEELTRAVLESGDAKFTGHDIPVTLHDSLMARLDRLGAAKEIIQIGAVIGGEFSYELLHAVHPIAEENLQRTLRTVVDAELLYVRGMAPDATYQFKHALIRDAAYEALLRSRRKELHSRIADVLVHEFSDKTALAPELLAHHYTEAGLVEEAIPAWQRAGLRATERSANVEAISHFTKALELLEAAPDSPERVQQEARLQITLGGALM